MSDPAVAKEPVEFDLERLLSYRLSVLSNRVSNAISSEYHRRFGLAITEWRVMAVLGRFPGLSAREVTERTAMDKVAVSRAVARLLERELVKREIHGDDRRRSVLTLSDAGVAVHAEVAPMVLACQENLISPLSEEEREMLDRLIDKLATVGMDEMLRHI